MIEKGGKGEERRGRGREGGRGRDGEVEREGEERERGREERRRRHKTAGRGEAAMLQGARGSAREHTGRRV